MLFCSQVTEIGGSFHAGLWSLSALAHCCQTMTLILRTDSKPRLFPVSGSPGARHGLTYLFCDLLVSQGCSLSGLGGSYTRNNLSHHVLFTGFFTWPCSRLSYPLKFMTCSWWEYESTQERDKEYICSVCSRHASSAAIPHGTHYVVSFKVLVFYKKCLSVWLLRSPRAMEPD